MHASRVSRGVTKALGAGLCLAALFMVGCGGGDDDSSGTAATTASGDSGAKELKIGAAYPNFTPFYSVMYGFTEDQMAEQGAGELLEPANANYDAARQITDIRNLIGIGANGLLLAIADPKAITPGLDYAASQDVPVVALDVAPGRGEVYMVVRADNQRMAEEACRALGERIGGRGTVLELQGDLASINAQDRTKGFEDCMAENYPDVKIIARETKWKTDVSANHAQTVLNANPDLAGIYMQSDTIDLAGVKQALKSVGRAAKVGERGHVAVVGIDGTPQGLAAVRDGTVDAIVSQPIDLYARFGVYYLLQAAAGKVQRVGPTDHDSTIVETTDGNLEDRLPSPVVTKDNVDDPKLWGNAAAGAKSE